MEDKIVYVPVSVYDRTQPMPVGENFIVLFDNNEVRRFYDEAPFAIATHWLKPTPLSELLTTEDSIKQLFVDKLISELKEKDEQIKELREALQKIMEISGYEPWQNIYNIGKSILQKHNSITNK